jgi:hypothetical protein
VSKVGVGGPGVGEAGAPVQAASEASRTKTNTLAHRWTGWNMLAVNGVMMISVPIIAQANMEKSLIHDRQWVL